MLLWMMFAFVVVAGLFPKSSIGRAVREALFGDPTRPAAKLKLPKLHHALLVILIMVAAGPAMPFELALFFAGDLATYFELIAATTVLGALINLRGPLKAFASALVKRVSKVFSAARASLRVGQRSPRIRRQRGKPAKHEEEPGFAFA